MTRRTTWTAAPAFLLGLATVSGGDCTGDDGQGEACGPAEAVVARVIDGDTVELADGEKVRYLMADAPEVSGDPPDCYGLEALELNNQLVGGQRIDLRYDRECRDRYDRLLAYVSIQGREVNGLLIDRGYACVLYIPPNGEARRDEYTDMEAAARTERRGMWGACEDVACDD